MTDTPKINRDLLKEARGCGLALVLLTIPREERDAPTILGYEATYRGRIRGKASNEGEKKKASQIDPVELPEERIPSVEKPLQGALRLPTEGEPFAEEAEEEMPPRSMRAVLQEKLEREKAEKKKSGASGSGPSQKVPPPPNHRNVL